jgi:DNA-binding Lrp family transcriptional regulator
MVQLTDLDQRIIGCLLQNVRLPASEVARRVGSNERTVRNHIDKLMAKGVFRPSAVLSPEALGFSISVDIFITLDPTKEDEAIETLLRHPQVTYLAYSSGEQDISVQAVFKDSNQLYIFMRNELSAIPGIKSSRTVLTAKVLKSPSQWAPVLSDLGTDR